MSVSIKNFANRTVTIILNSQSAAHLPPGYLLERVSEAEVVGNPNVEKLKSLGLIEVRPVASTRVAKPVVQPAAPLSKKRNSPARLPAPTREKASEMDVVS